ncbi:solute carrier family 40 member 1-like isoform X2 [Stegostoma tigrinum]|nr:solute carrier family 40 member 1-like isoform X2 [Stegostoma tigrinum]XP_048389936.1 solute carrier family 40 member 1-like isoform X2 [Stegostoma tigrinum]XP_059503212.1 solute carrier family 40 member 1-like isoform X2 [Stegostoma tigrinum]XP_059503213.1 solute carrier family 40 member 1-like isoform X2 [Stegostoma tigrinum]XP_059503214.1 solute carrier family 40 member 1-like isoform X2 [Stegostoma tigrinum]XP_059503215.1 solute carrier family 40 member 1-like isoform X2 [Stegostoma tig
MDFEIEEEPSVSISTHHSRNKKEGCLKGLDSTWRFLQSAHFFIYLAHLLSTWGDRMWHFAVSLFLVELYENSLLLPAVFGLAVSSSLILFGALVGNWVDRNTRMKVVQVALLIQNLSVILCAVVLMLLFVYETEITILWNGWMKIVCYALVIVIGVIADLASTAMSIAIQRDWIIVVAGDSDKLSSMNATLRQIDLLSKLLSPMSVGQIMTFSSSVVGCGFIAGWNLFSVCFEYLLLKKIYKMTPGLAKKGDNQNKDEEVSEQNQTTFKDERVTSAPVSVEGELINNTSTNRNDKETGCIKGTLVSGIRTFRDGWIIYYKQPMFLAALGLSFLYMTVLGFDGITTGYAYAQGVSSSVLSIMVALSALTGLIGTMFFTISRKYCGLIHTGCFSSIAQIICLTLCIASVFAPGSPFDLSVPLYSSASDQLETYTTATFPTDVLNASVTKQSLINKHIPYDETSQLPTNLTNSTETKEYLSIALYFAGAVSARVGLWSFDLTVTQLTQEMVYESKRGIVNGVQGSMNGIMDLLRFVFVIIIPAPEHFGILIILSVAFVSVGTYPGSGLSLRELVRPAGCLDQCGQVRSLKRWATVPFHLSTEMKGEGKTLSASFLLFSISADS